LGQWGVWIRRCCRIVHLASTIRIDPLLHVDT
jgi:hypothetical protein